MNSPFSMRILVGVRRGFSLIELLAAVGVLGILAALLVPALSGMLEKGRNARCLGNLHQMGVTILAYANDNDGFLPSKSSPLWTSQIWSYVYPGTTAPAAPSDRFPQEYVRTIFECPEARHDLASIQKPARNYGFNYRIGDGDSETADKAAKVIQSSKVALVGDASESSGLNESNLQPRHKGMFNILYADFHVAAKAPGADTKSYNSVFWGRLDAEKYWDRFPQ